MNERIKQLMAQAGMLYTMDPKPTHIEENGTHTFQEINVYKNFDPEKFAELIVRECMTVARGADGLDATHEAWYLIERHFGVEE
jgi:hypothetical protein